MTEKARKRKKKKIKLLNFSLFLFLVSSTIFFAFTTFLKAYENKLSNDIKIVEAQIDSIQLEADSLEITTNPE